MITRIFFILCGLCELCEQRPKAGRGGTPGELKTCYFMDPPEGVPRTAKTVAALCPDCYERVTQAPALADLKLLKRKARRKGTDGVAVTSKAKPSPPPKAQRATQRPPQGLPRKAHRRPR